MPIEETMEALHDVVKAGKALYIGASSMYAWQFSKAQYTADLQGWTRFVSMQNHMNLVYREEEREMLPSVSWIRASASFPGVRWRADSWPAIDRREGEAADDTGQGRFLCPRNVL